MAIQECGNGHLYDTDQYASCPYCRGAEIESISERAEPEQLLRQGENLEKLLRQQ